eukprot:scaffold27216_cov65-Phaeocystis_antarctica.AAC.2
MTSASSYSSEPTVIGDLGHVVVVEPVDVVHGLDDGQDEQVGLVLAQLGAAPQYDVLEQFDELVAPVGRHMP